MAGYVKAASEVVTSTITRSSLATFKDIAFTLPATPSAQPSKKMQSEDYAQGQSVLPLVLHSQMDDVTHCEFPQFTLALWPN